MLARIVSSQSCSAISWTWRCSPDKKPWHRSDPQSPRGGEGNDALFSQGLDNPLWVAHMTHPTDYDYDYDYDGPPLNLYFPLSCLSIL